MKQNTKWILVLRVKKTLSEQVAYQLQRVAQPSCQEEAGFRYGAALVLSSPTNRRLLFKVYVFTGLHMIDFRQIHWPTEAWFPQNVVVMKEEKAAFLSVVLVLLQWRIRGERPGGPGPPLISGSWWPPPPPPPPPLSEGLEPSLCGFVATVVRDRKWFWSKFLVIWVV